MAKALRGMYVVGAALVLLAGVVLAETVEISPHRIILNQQGQADDVLAIMPMVFTPGYSFGEAEATLSFNGEVVSETVDIRYCYVDLNLLIYFDRAQLLANPTVVALAGNEVTATVTGSFTAVNADGDSYTQSFEASDLVEILAPGRAGAKAK